MEHTLQEDNACHTVFFKNVTGLSTET